MTQVALSEYRGVWLFVFFDLPVDSKAARKRYANFRKSLLSYGFSMLQFSVYSRYYGSEEASKTSRDLIKAGMPPDGQVRLLTVTDRQFGKMDVFYGKKRKDPESKPDQLLLF